MGGINHDLRQPDDTPQFRAAIDWLDNQGFKATRPSPHQLKIGPFNFYPNKGSWNSDFDPKRKTGGLKVIEKKLRGWCP
ncbi:hypothetical protein HY78_02195 [Rhizorhabdus wittichii DC-6]|nr:hypothetical protein HY78_02195 [Rhizorhabdus wittichii DC-6]